jgi:DNA-binding transcriptional MerR regulator
MALAAGQEAGICTVSEASKIIGITVATLNMWDHTDFIRPSEMELRGRQKIRLYSFRDLVALRVANRLRQDGIPLQSLRRVVDYLRKRDGSEHPLATVYLVAVGDDVCECRGDEALLSVLKQPGQYKLVVNISEAVEEVQHGIEELQAA